MFVWWPLLCAITGVKLYFRCPHAVTVVTEMNLMVKLFGSYWPSVSGMQKEMIFRERWRDTRKSFNAFPIDICENYWQSYLRISFCFYILKKSKVNARFTCDGFIRARNFCLKPRRCISYMNKLISTSISMHVKFFN